MRLAIAFRRGDSVRVVLARRLPSQAGRSAGRPSGLLSHTAGNHARCRDLAPATVTTAGARAVGLAFLHAPDQIVAAEVDDIAVFDAGGGQAGGDAGGVEDALEAIGGLLVAEVGHLR